MLGHERDQARAAARPHRGHRTHERALTHEGQAVGGVLYGYHDASFESALIAWFDNGNDSKESLLRCQHPAPMAMLLICGIASTRHLEQHHRDTPA